MKDLILVMGSDSDKDNANKVLAIWKSIGLDYKVSVASCHKHGGGEFAKFIFGIEEKIIVFIGGMSLAAPGLIEVLLKKADRYDAIVFAIATDIAARSAVEDLPKGTSIITSGLNQVSLTHSLVNSALATARLAAMLTGKEIIFEGLKKWYKENADQNPLCANVELDKNGLIP